MHVSLATARSSSVVMLQVAEQPKRHKSTKRKRSDPDMGSQRLASAATGSTASQPSTAAKLAETVCSDGDGELQSCGMPTTEGNKSNKRHMAVVADAGGGDVLSPGKDEAEVQSFRHCRMLFWL